MAGKHGSRWKHGWVPLNMMAAKLKAHGSRKGMRKIVLAEGSKVRPSDKQAVRDAIRREQGYPGTSGRPSRGRVTRSSVRVR